MSYFIPQNQINRNKIQIHLRSFLIIKRGSEKIKKFHEVQDLESKTIWFFSSKLKVLNMTKVFLEKRFNKNFNQNFDSSSRNILMMIPVWNRILYRTKCSNDLYISNCDWPITFSKQTRFKSHQVNRSRFKKCPG